MGVIPFQPKPGSVEHTRMKGCYEEIATELRQCERDLAGEITNHGGRYEYARFEEIDRKARRCSWIARQMLEADRGSITWADARLNVFAVSSPEWLERSTAAPLRAEAEARAKELRSTLFDIASRQPPGVT